MRRAWRHKFQSSGPTVYSYSVYKKRLVFEIQISHIVLNSSDKYTCLESFSEPLNKRLYILMGHDRLISFVNKTRFYQVSLTLGSLEQSDHNGYD